MGHQFGGPPEEINMVAMRKEVNQNPRPNTMDSYTKFEQEVADNPDGFNNLVIEFQYPDPADPTKLTKTERVPEKFEVKWTTAAGEADSRPFENLPPQKRVGVN